APSQVSVVQGSPSSRQAAPTLPAGCVHVALVPLHRSAVQGLPSSVQGVVLDLKTSVGQVALVPVQVSAASHSLVPARHTVLADRKPLAGQVVLVPLHWSRVQGLPSSAQAAPVLPTGCWQVLLVPSHWSRVQGLLSELQAVPLAFLTSVVGQVALEPVQFSARSHSPAAARQ